ncbi:hypothetical protein THASP1DRAFT_22673 [Thamnocephalis sphaerospora]|uniref:C2H2-type domain-containing protein n=1 Tax=Thamnocephalis sphaerospora TaxID=78915 RepID=A0A4V1IX16_9FUNG|nr:hypothetical protein THASP1DRAFT_22673 [Thamnocephalis sphaerospora]|eukprot:RKP09489.1 hypothetical protein THASP1DRAFT_22673 [Thamnocephalis sphaerospora]
MTIHLARHAADLASPSTPTTTAFASTSMVHANAHADMVSADLPSVGMHADVEMTGAKPDPLPTLPSIASTGVLSGPASASAVSMAETPMEGPGGVGLPPPPHHYAYETRKPSPYPSEDSMVVMTVVEEPGMPTGAPVSRHTMYPSISPSPHHPSQRPSAPAAHSAPTRALTMPLMHNGAHPPHASASGPAPNTSPPMSGNALWNVVKEGPFWCRWHGCQQTQEVGDAESGEMKRSDDTAAEESDGNANSGGKMFTDGHDIWQHILHVHLSPRPRRGHVFTCRWVNCNFTSVTGAYGAEMHLRGHLDWHPYCCKMCGVRFKRRGDYAKHMREKHNMRPGRDSQSPEPISPSNHGMAAYSPGTAMPPHYDLVDDGAGPGMVMRDPYGRPIPHASPNANMRRVSLDSGYMSYGGPRSREPRRSFDQHHSYQPYGLHPPHYHHPYYHHQHYPGHPPPPPPPHHGSPSLTGPSSAAAMGVPARTSSASGPLPHLPRPMSAAAAFHYRPHHAQSMPYLGSSSAGLHGDTADPEVLHRQVMALDRNQRPAAVAAIIEGGDATVALRASPTSERMHASVVLPPIRTSSPSEAGLRNAAESSVLVSGTPSPLLQHPRPLHDTRLALPMPVPHNPAKFNVSWECTRRSPPSRPASIAVPEAAGSTRLSQAPMMRRQSTNTMLPVPQSYRPSDRTYGYEDAYGPHGSPHYLTNGFARGGDGDAHMSMAHSAPSTSMMHAPQPRVLHPLPFSSPSTASTALPAHDECAEEDHALSSQSSVPMEQDTPVPVHARKLPALSRLLGGEDTDMLPPSTQKRPRSGTLESLNNPKAQRHPSQRTESDGAPAAACASGGEDDDDASLRRLFRALLTLSDPRHMPEMEARQLLGTLSASQPRWRQVLAEMQPDEVACVFDSYARLRDRCDTHAAAAHVSGDRRAGASPIDILADVAETAPRAASVQPITPADSNMGEAVAAATLD